jgi:hypothetical protein
MPLDRQGIISGAWSGRPPHRPGPQLPAFCRTRRPTVMVTVSSLAGLRLLVFLVLLFQLSTLLLVLAGPMPAPRRSQAGAPLATTDAAGAPVLSLSQL